jgi:thiol-disulfide isomerase/thioredoxin
MYARIASFSLIAILPLLLFCTQQPASGQSGSVHVAESVTNRGGGKALEFTWKDGSRSQSFAQVTSGKVVLLNIWATWCGPCRREIPDLIQVSTEMASKGVVVVGVSVDDNDDRVRTVKNFVEKNRIPYVNVIDNDNKDIARAYGVQSIPMTLIIDRQGKIVEKIMGARSKDVFMQALARVL